MDVIFIIPLTFKLVSGFLHTQEPSCITSSGPTLRRLLLVSFFQGPVHEKEWEDEPKTSAPPEASVKTTAHFHLGQNVWLGKILIFCEKRRLFFIILWAAQTLCNSDESSLSPECVRSSRRKNQSTQSASLLSNWPELLPCRHSLRGIWRHFTEAHLQISYFSIQCIPLLNIKTYGSHYLHIGCKGWSGQREKKVRSYYKFNFVERESDILPKEVRSHWWRPSGDERNWETQSFMCAWLGRLNDFLAD